MDGRFEAESDNYGKLQSRKSTQKRQKQYFEQRKRQQQNLQIMGSESSSDVLGKSGQHLKEHQSLDILNLLNLSTNAQECDSPYVKGSADAEANVSTMPGNIWKNRPTTFTSMANPVETFRIEEARVPLGSQIDSSQKKVLVSAPDHQNGNGALNGILCKSTNLKTVTDQHVGLSVIDLLDDEGPKTAVGEHPTLEDHVAFSLEGLGKVGAETPVHSPQQPNRIPYNSQLLKDGKKKLSKAVNHVLENLELEVDTMMQDINAAPISSFSNFPYNKGRRSLAASQDYNHFHDQANKNGSSIRQEFFYNSENKDDDIWNVPSYSFLDEKFDNEREYDTSWKKKTFRRGTNSPDLLKSEACKASYAFEDYLPKKRSPAVAMEGFDTIELPATYSKYQSENDYDYDFFIASGARCSRSDGNFNVQSLVPEDVRDNSSLLSEESISSTAVRGEAIAHSSSRLVTGEISKEHKCGFGRPESNCRSKEGKCRSASNSSGQKPSHYSKSIIEEELGAHNSWQFEDRYASFKINSADTSFCQNSEAKFAVTGSNIRNVDPFSMFTTPKSHDKASHSFSGLKSSAHVADSPPCYFTSEKFAFGESHVFSDVRSWSSSPNFSPKFQSKGNPKDGASFHFETPSPDCLLKSASKDESMKLKKHDSPGNSELREEIFMGNNRWSSEEKIVGDTSTSNNHTEDCEVDKDTNIFVAQSLETTNSLGHAKESSSSSRKKPDKNERKVDKTENNCDAETPLKCKSANEDMKTLQPEERSIVTRKHNKERIKLSGEVTFQSYVFQLLCVQKVLKGDSLASI